MRPTTNTEGLMGVCLSTNEIESAKTLIRMRTFSVSS